MKVRSIIKGLIFLMAVSDGNILLAKNDWAQFSKYASDNDSLKALPVDKRPKVIFMGNSITEGWLKEDPVFFTKNNYACRGISGQTTYQMLNRFREDVINLKPEVVVITAGTNDIAENNHSYNEDITLGNIISMVELARLNDIKVILTSVLPTNHFYWNPQMTGIPEKLMSLNKKIKEYADSQSLEYADYFSAMLGDNYGMKDGLSIDGVHPSLEGYKIMEDIISPIISSELKDASPIVISLWDNVSPLTNNGLEDDDEIKENENWIRMVTQPVLYVFPAKNPNGKALLMLPGGGYEGVAISHEGKEFAPYLNEEGITLAVLKYRMPNGYKEVPLEDVERAMKIINDNSQNWGIDTQKIGIGGASAGGHLAATYATHLKKDSLKPAFQVLFYPVISMKDDITHPGSKKNLLGENPSNDIIEIYSNEMQVTNETSPAFIVVSGDDDVVPIKNSLNYANILQRKGIPVSLHIYPIGGHGWGTNKDFPYHDAMILELKSWLKLLK